MNPTPRGLVDAFMHSEWPPADLLVAAHAANVACDVVDLVSSRYGGKDCRKAILNDLERLPEEYAGRVVERNGRSPSQPFPPLIAILSKVLVLRRMPASSGNPAIQTGLHHFWLSGNW